MGVSPQQKAALLQTGIDSIPVEGRTLLYETGCLTWAQMGATPDAMEQTLLIYASQWEGAAALNAMHKRTHCFNVLSNLVLLHTHATSVAFASQEGLVKDGFYRSPPQLESLLMQHYSPLFEGRTGEMQAFVAEMLAALLTALFNPLAAKQSLSLMHLARHCYLRNKDLVAAMREAGLMFKPAQIKP